MNDVIIKGKTFNNSEEALDSSVLPDKRIYETPILAVQYHIYISGEISSDASDYTGIFDTLNRKATELDTVFVHINSPGGSVSTTVQLVHALVCCPANTVASIESECCSGATMVALSCKSFQIGSFSNFMIHSPTVFDFGKFPDFQASAEHSKKYYSKLYKEVYKGFLTDEEIDQTLAGKDFWFQSDEIFERCQRFLELKQEPSGKERIKAKKKVPAKSKLKKLTKNKD